jgi:probable O-glycosylation ligase (exosortase A-associated)
MRDIAVTLAVFGSLPFILRRPWIGVLVWTWLGFMNPHRLAWGFSTTMPFAMIVAGTTMVAMLFSKEAKKIPWTRELTLLVMFWTWTLVTTFNAMYPAQAWEQFSKVSKIFLMILVASMLINTPGRLKALVCVIALSIGFYGFKGGIFTVTTGGAYQVRGPSTSFISGNNEIGLALAMTIPFLFLLARYAPKTYLRVGMLTTAALTALAALGTQSRGALLGIGAMAVFLWLKSRSKVLTGIMIALFIAIALPLMPESWYARMSTIQAYDADASAQGRINAWRMAFNLALHRPTGGGFESFQDAAFWLYAPDATNVHDSHSIYFQVLGHHGFIGLTIFLAMIAFTWFSASRIIRTAKRKKTPLWLRDLMASVQVSLVAYLTAGAFLGLAYFDYLYNLIVIVVVARVLVAQAAAGSSRFTDGQRDGGGAAPKPVPLSRAAANPHALAR